MAELKTYTPEFYSKPVAGKTMLGLLKKFGPDLHFVHELLIEELVKIENCIEEPSWKENVILFQYESKQEKFITESKARLIGASLISNWIIGVILNEIPKNSNLIEAEKWFHNYTEDRCISVNLSQSVEVKVVKILFNVIDDLRLDVLPYIFEVFETGNEAIKKSGKNRVLKKKNGVYYTPSDVIEFIIKRSISIRPERSDKRKEFSWFDPALGTGSFLISVLNYFSLEYEKYSSEKFISNYLFGADISPYALQSATYLIAANGFLLSNKKPISINKLAKKIGENLTLIDSTTITKKERLTKLFPNLKTNGFDFIVSNPPYSRKKQQLSLFTENVDLNQGASKELYPHFLKILIDLSKTKNGGGGMVVPLSLATNTNNRFKCLRNYIQSKNGRIEFWNFDRTPDSLFGDDVKTRNTIFFFNQNKNQPKIKSTDLHRWNSRNRDKLFQSILNYDYKNNIDITEAVPKIGDEFGANIFYQINSVRENNLNNVLETTSSNPEISIKNTAYNWLPIELIFESKSIGSSGRTYWTTKSSQISPYVIYALLNSRICYWLWRVWCDGFHLTNQFIKSLPFGKSFFNELNTDTLKVLGVNLWDSVQSNKIINKNAGHIIYTYNPLKSQRLIDQIDKVVVKHFNLPLNTIDYWKDYIDNLIKAGRCK